MIQTKTTIKDKKDMEKKLNILKTILIKLREDGLSDYEILKITKIILMKNDENNIKNIKSPIIRRTPKQKPKEKPPIKSAPIRASRRQLRTNDLLKKEKR